MSSLLLGNHQEYIPSTKESFYDFFRHSLLHLAKLKCHVFQTFSGDKTSTSLKRKFHLEANEIHSLSKLLQKNGQIVCFHEILNLNMASPLSRAYYWNFQNIMYDAQLLQKLVPEGQRCYMIAHMGSFKTKRFHLTKKEGMDDWIANTKYFLKETKKYHCTNPRLLYETPSTFTNKIGAHWEDYRTFWMAFTPSEKKRIGFCLDTAHLFVLGIPVHTLEGIQSVLEQFPRDSIGAIHLNDATYPLGSYHDVHASIGSGRIFSPYYGGSFQALKKWLEIATELNIPCILETRNVHFKQELQWIHTIQKMSYEQLAEIEKVETKWKKFLPKYHGPTGYTFTPSGMVGCGSDSKKDYYEQIVEIFETLEEFHRSMPKSEQNAGTPYRIRAYQQAVQYLHSHPHPIYTKEDVMNYYSELGKKTLEKMVEIVETGTLELYEEIQKIEWFHQRREFLSIIGFGPSKVDEIMKRGIRTIEELKKDKSIRLTDLQKKGLEYAGKLEMKIPRKVIEEIVGKMEKIVEKDVRIFKAGSYRTGKLMTGDIDVLFSSEKWETMKDVENHSSEILKEIGTPFDPFYQSNVHAMGVYLYKKKYYQMDIRMVPWRNVETYLLYFGSGVHFSRLLRGHAKRKGYRLTEWGLIDERTQKRVELYTEREIMNFLGVMYVPPEQRRGIYQLPLL